MSSYRLTWVTDNLAVGHAPMSFDDIQTIKDAGINAIVNLCGEFCDLHNIERQSGFDVCYLPIPDDGAPDLQEIDKALAWLDEAIYLGKKVLVHCRHGVGRTGTFLTSYLLRRGFALKQAKKVLGKVHSTPTSFYQWRLLRKYDKTTEKLTTRAPCLESRHPVDLTPFFAEYEELVARIERRSAAASRSSLTPQRCGDETDACCVTPLHLQLIEAAYLSHHKNRRLRQAERATAITRALAMMRSRYLVPASTVNGVEEYRCPLSVEGKCIAFAYRPIACRLYGSSPPPGVPEDNMAPCTSRLRAPRVASARASVDKALHTLSQHVFFALTSAFLGEGELFFPITHVVSGKFVEDYFNFLSK